MYLTLKRVTDIGISLLGTLTFFPVGMIIGTLIFIESRRPIFFIQNRVGKDGKVFKMYKFRSMINGAERYSGPVWAKKNDPRVTPFGRILRKTRLDELPQLLNILKGEMSLVGLRTERSKFIQVL